MNFFYKKMTFKMAVIVYAIFLLFPEPCYGSEDRGKELIGQMELERVEDETQKLLEDDLSFQKMTEGLLEGKSPFAQIQEEMTVKNILFHTVGISGRMFAKIVLLALAASLFSNLSAAFKNRQLGDISFYIVYMLLVLSLVHIFQEHMGQMWDKVSAVTEFMKALLPSYHLAVAAASGPMTSAAFYQIIILVIFLSEHLILALVLPAIRVYFLLALVNYLTGEEFLSRMTDLLENCIRWMLKTMVGVIVGFQLIQRLLSPAFDAWRRTAMGKTVEAVPLVGDLMDGAARVVLGSAVLIKNCVGAAAVTVLVLAALPPVIHTGVGMLFYQFMAALIQPVSDKRMTGCLHTMGVSMGMLLKVLFTLDVMFILTIAILAGSLG